MQEKLIKLRKSRDLTQDDLANYLNIVKKTYANKENGKTQFTSDEMFALARFFKRSIEDIFLPSTYQNGKSTDSLSN